MWEKATVWDTHQGTNEKSVHMISPRPRAQCGPKHQVNCAAGTLAWDYKCCFFHNCNWDLLYQEQCSSGPLIIKASTAFDNLSLCQMTWSYLLSDGIGSSVSLTLARTQIKTDTQLRWGCGSMLGLSLLCSWHSHWETIKGNFHHVQKCSTGDLWSQYCDSFDHPLQRNKGPLFL